MPRRASIRAQVSSGIHRSSDCTAKAWQRRRNDRVSHVGETYRIEVSGMERKSEHTSHLTARRVASRTGRPPLHFRTPHLTPSPSPPITTLAATMAPSGTVTHSLSRKASAPSSLASPKMEQQGFGSAGGNGSSFFDAASMPSALLPPGPGVPAMPSPTPVGAGAAHVRDVLQRRISSFVYLKRTLLG